VQEEINRGKPMIEFSTYGKAGESKRASEVKLEAEISRLKSTIKLIWQTAGEPEAPLPFDSLRSKDRRVKLEKIISICRKELQ